MDQNTSAAEAFPIAAEEIREFIRLANEGGVEEFEAWHGRGRIRIRPRAKVATAEASTASQVESIPVLEADVTLVRSPLAGIYRDAITPGAEPFVSVGAAVKPGRILCLIEAGGMLNEIEAGVAGVIVRKLVEDGAVVEVGAELFGVK